MRKSSGVRFLENWEKALSGLIGTDEALLDRWIRIFDVMHVARKVRPVRSFMLNGRITLEEKVSFFRNVLAQALGEDVPDNLETLIVPLVGGNLWDDLPALREMLVKRFDARAGRVVVEISSPEDLPADIQGKVLQALEIMVNSEEGRKAGIKKTISLPQQLSVRPVWKKNPSLLAGLELRIGSHVWDNSLAAKLRELERKLLVRG